jgi:hypothetical protein
MHYLRRLHALIRATPDQILFVMLLNAFEHRCIKSRVRSGCFKYIATLYFLLAPVVKAGAACDDVLDASKRCSYRAPEDAPSPRKQAEAAFDVATVQGQIVIERILGVRKHLRRSRAGMVGQFLLSAPKCLIKNNMELGRQFSFLYCLVQPATYIL